MMAAEQLRHDDLIARLPAVRGRLSAQAGLADITWFRVGGPADVMFRPADRDDLIAFLKNKPADVAVTVLGVGSNTLVRDGGVDGVVIRLGRDFAIVTACDNNEIEAGAGALDVNVAQTAQMHGIAGLEFLRGIPGTVGGGLRMNAGAYGTEFKDVLVWAEAVDVQGNLHRLSPAEMKFGYRHCGVPEDWIFLGCRLKGRPGDKTDIQARMDEIQAAREGSQPIRSRTGGSTFANPEGHKAWQLIDAAGCRGLVVGDAQVSEQHCNFLINRGNATATDLETLGETVRRRVKETSGVDLRWEIKRIGRQKDGGHE
ncbi:UDP-N-acetylmuramate dehydrogenase [Ferrovibrio sp.]|uniref:UDP-N-acetylmuramate dehydrogenase n=1 Tax=Ferrovibrio sp. TaxID=1917215 RepID=UPI00260768A5|nr:UDP-N-acetylmuramate dehydrogenase [Ferrovibrio sp.]